jgi:hypothetical protein
MPIANTISSLTPSGLPDASGGSIRDIAADQLRGWFASLAVSRLDLRACSAAGSSVEAFRFRFLGACQLLPDSNVSTGDRVASPNSSAAGTAGIYDRSTEVPQIERQSAQLVELIEELGDAFVAAVADDHVDEEEAESLLEGFHRVSQFAMDHDECSAIGIAILRSGVTSQRSQRLLRQREDRMSFERGSASAVA